MYIQCLFYPHSLPLSLSALLSSLIFIFDVYALTWSEISYMTNFWRKREPSNNYTLLRELSQPHSSSGSTHRNTFKQTNSRLAFVSVLRKAGSSVRPTRNSGLVATAQNENIPKMYPNTYIQDFQRKCKPRTRAWAGLGPVRAGGRFVFCLFWVSWISWMNLGYLWTYFWYVFAVRFGIFLVYSRQPRGTLKRPGWSSVFWERLGPRYDQPATADWSRQRIGRVGPASNK